LIRGFVVAWGDVVLRVYRYHPVLLWDYNVKVVDIVVKSVFSFGREVGGV